MNEAENAVVRFVRLPVTVRAVTIPSPNGFYNIYINSALSLSAQQSAYLHELKHIQKNHFYDEAPVAQNEREANEPTPDGFTAAG